MPFYTLLIRHWQDAVTLVIETCIIHWSGHRKKEMESDRHSRKHVVVVEPIRESIRRRLHEK